MSGRAHADAAARVRTRRGLPVRVGTVFIDRGDPVRIAATCETCERLAASLPPFEAGVVGRRGRRGPNGGGEILAAEIARVTVHRWHQRCTPEAGCQRWSPIHNRHGYGDFSLNGRNVRAHRVGYVLHTGVDLPLGTLLRHTCDHTWCVDGSHVIPGTPRQNSQDHKERGRWLGLAATDIAAIRASSESRRALAEQYGRTTNTIGMMIRNQTFYDPSYMPPADTRYEDRIDFMAVAELHTKGVSIKALAEQFNMSYSRMWEIVRGTPSARWRR